MVGNVGNFDIASLLKIRRKSVKKSAKYGAHRVFQPILKNDKVFSVLLG